MENFYNDHAPVVHVDFCCIKSKQKMLIDALLRYSKADLVHIAELLDISESELKAVWDGESFLPVDTSKALSKLFLFFFGGN